MVKDVARRAGKGLLAHNALGLAAELSYFTFLAIFPFLICLVALAGMLPAIDLLDEVDQLVSSAAPKAVVDAMLGQMIQLSRANNILIIGLGLAGALWSGSSAVHALMSAVNRAYDVQDRRRWKEVRVIALWVTVAGATLVIGLLALVTVLPRIAATMPEARGVLWTVLAGSWRWIFVWTAITLGATVVYFVSLDRQDRWRVRLLPGAALAASIWTIATLCLHLYVSSVGRYGLTYGALGGAMFLLLWFYFTNLSVLVGAEVNGELSETKKRQR